MERTSNLRQVWVLFGVIVALLLVLFNALQPAPVPEPVPPNATTIPTQTMVKRHFVAEMPDVSPEILQQAAAVLQQRLFALGAQRITTGTFLEDRITAEELVTADLEVTTHAVRQQGVIELVDFSAVADPAVHIGNTIPTTALDAAQAQGQYIFAVSHFGGPTGGDHFPTLLIGSIFEEVTLTSTSLQFALNDRAVALLMAQNAQTHLLAFTLDGVVIDTLTLTDGRFGTLNMPDSSSARQLTAIMKSGPLPIPFKHILNDYFDAP